MYIRKIVLFLALCAAMSFANLPLPLQPNIHRTADRDSVFRLELQTNSAFWEPQNLTFRARMDAAFSENVDQSGRVILYFIDSIGNDYLQLVFSGFFDNRAVHGRTVDWARPGDRSDTGSRSTFDLYRAFLTFTPNEYIKIGLGKEYYNWGPSELGGLMLSDYNTGFVGLYQQYQIGPFTIRGLATQLSSQEWREPPGNGYLDNHIMPIHRFFSAGRIEFYRELWGLALKQAIIYGGVNRSFEIPYLIPIFPFHYAQMSNWRYGNWGSNTLVGLDAYANFLDKNLQIYGELLVDDFQMDEDDASKSIQNLIGFVAGTRFNIPNILYGFFEGGQINSFVYNSMSGDLGRYLNRDAFIGSPLGPDNQLFWGKLGRHFERIGLRTELYFWLLRQGERDINLRYNHNYLLGTRNDRIPYGNVRRETATWLSAIYEFKHNTVELYGGIQNFRTEGVSGTSKTSPFFGLSLNAAIGLGWNAR
ncbi:MAG: capsule assembly Wzi family protein [Chitinivibrionia bacterium]|nr:capsule assembly Wzi family protein [Chitinivibrionia bacterium]